MIIEQNGRRFKLFTDYSDLKAYILNYDIELTDSEKMMMSYMRLGSIKELMLEIK